MSPAESFATNQNFGSAKEVLDRLIVPSKALDRLICCGSKVRLQPCFLAPLILQFGGYLDPLISKKALIAWFDLIPVTNTSTQDIQVTTP